MTSKEVSARLKELGFKAETKMVWGLFPSNNPDKVDEWKYMMSVNPKQAKDPIPAYDAEVLFRWLVDHNVPFTIDGKGLALFGKNIHESFIYWDDYVDGNLADMLGESIIWILENEK